MKKMYTIFILLLGVFNLSCSESKTGTYSENKTEKMHQTFFHFYLLDVHFAKHPLRKFIFFTETASKI